MSTINSIDSNIPIQISLGGTNSTSMANSNGVIYYDGTRLVTTTVGTAGDVLTSNGAGVAPTFQTGGGGGITTIAGDTGSATGSTVTLTGSTRGFTFDATGSTVTVTSVYLGLPSSDSAPSMGYINIGSEVVMNAFPVGSLFLGGGSGHFDASNTGTANFALGSNCFNGVTSGNNNVAIGGSCLSAGVLTGSQNIAIGGSALGSCSSGGVNIAIGANSPLGTLSTGTDNIAIGDGAGDSLDTGSENILIGIGSGSAYTGAESDNIIIGINGGHNGTNNELLIGGGTGTGSGEINYCAISGIAGITVTGSPVLVDAATDQLGVAVSSRRFKENIRNMGDTNLMNLNPVIFNYKNDESKTVQYGLIAEEVEEVMPELVAYDKNKIPFSVKYHEMPAILLNEIQRQEKIINHLSSRIDILEKLLQEYDNGK